MATPRSKPKSKLKTPKKSTVLTERQPILRLAGVSRLYSQGRGRTAALEQVSLEAYPGEFIAVVGASGSGKSTLLNLAAGLDLPDAGKVYFENHDLGLLPDSKRSALRRQKMGFVFQSYQLLPTLSVLENVMMPARLDRRPPGDSRLEALSLLGRLGLLGREKDFPDQLSGGEQQRVAVCRALINQPSLILADEPTGNLHHQGSLELLGLFAQLCKNGKVSVLMATHNTEAKKFATRVIRLEDGLVAGEGSGRRKPGKNVDSL